MTLNGGALAYESKETAEPLTQEEEAALAFAACGFTGYALGELPFQNGGVPETGGGNILSQFFGRTAPSGDAIHAARVFVINDEAAYMLKRPLDCTKEEFESLARAAAEGDVLRFYRDARVKIADHRVDQPRQLPYLLGFNNWSVNQPGTTYFVPVHEMSGFLINVLLAIFDSEFNYFVVDDTAMFRPAGIKKFARSKGGRLNDDAKAWRTMPIGTLDAWLHEFAAVEQGAILQNLGLMTQALGLGGFAHFAHHPWGWPQALGFRIKNDRFSRAAGMSAPVALLTRLLGRDIEVPVPLGLTVGGKHLIRPYCPPYYESMEDAVLSYIDSKFGASGTITDATGQSWFKNPAAVSASISRPSHAAVEATVACCEYIYRRFGRIPATNGPARTVLAYQAHHLDRAFYDEFYSSNALSETQRGHDHG